MIRSLTLAAFLAASGTAAAGEAQSALDMAKHIFDSADSDKNGALTINEHKAAGLGRLGAEFSTFDLDKDSKVTWEEYKTVFERHHSDLKGRSA